MWQEIIDLVSEQLGDDEAGSLTILLCKNSETAIQANRIISAGVDHFWDHFYFSAKENHEFITFDISKAGLSEVDKVGTHVRTLVLSIGLGEEDRDFFGLLQSKMVYVSSRLFCFDSLGRKQTDLGMLADSEDVPAVSEAGIRAIQNDLRIREAHRDELLAIARDMPFDEIANIDSDILKIDGEIRNASSRGRSIVDFNRLNAEREALLEKKTALWDRVMYAYHFDHQSISKIDEIIESLKADIELLSKPRGSK